MGEQSSSAVLTSVRSIPSWVVPLVMFFASRLYSTALLVGMFFVAVAQGLPFASGRISTSVLAYFGSWDATFYRRIADFGYPTSLPMAHGQVLHNVWAFLPVFPGIVRGVMTVTGADADAAGVGVALVCGAAASVVIARLLEPRVGRTAALWVVAMFDFGPVAFLLQLPYAESLFCLLIFASLWALTAERYLLVTVFGVIAAFTRPGELALPLAMGILLLVRLRTWRKTGSWTGWRLLAAIVVTTAAGLAWPIIAAVATGNRNAYLATELSWWTGFVGTPPFVPFSPWFLMATRYLNIAGIVLVVVIIAATAWWLSRASIRALGPEIVLFGGGYALYLVAVFLPQQSLFRLLLPLTPLLGDPVLSQSKRARWVLLAVGAALQPVAVVLLWFLGYP
jgi:hypothetical protein